MSRLITAAAAAGLLLGTGLLTGCGNTPAASKVGMESGKMSAMEGKMLGDNMQGGNMDDMMAREKMTEGKMMEGKMDAEVMTTGKMDGK